MQKKKIRLEIRLSEEEARLFQNKAESYGGNVSAMVRDAVRLFDDKRTRGKLMAMEGLLQYYKKYYWCPLNRYNDLWNPFGLKKSRSKHYATSPSFNFVHFQEGLPKPSPMLPPNPFPGVPRIHERQYST